jgi:N-acyl-D-glutamate deacylase
LLWLARGAAANETYDVVIMNGRVIDPDTNLDAVRNLGLNGGSIKVITKAQLSGRTVIDARGLIVAPGFIDLHQHGQDE